MEDKRYLVPLGAMAAELDRNIVEFNRRLSGVEDKDAICALRREQYERIEEMIGRHKRAIDFMQGNPVEPQHHFGEAVLLPVFGDIG